MTVPPEAVRRAALVLSCAEGEYDEDDYRVAGDVLEAAAPAIRAAVYAEVRQLAIGHSNTPTWAAVISGDKALRQFADLITRPQPARGGTAAARRRPPAGGSA